jgi:Phospholipase_D-nuclease N-terminal
MLLSGVLFVLFLAGCWLYCLADVILTPAEAFPGWRKRTWIVVICVTMIAGAIAWLIARRTWYSRQRPSADAANLMIVDRTGAQVLWYPQPPAETAVTRHPAGRERGSAERNAPQGPDDDPEFLRELAQRIHGTPTDPAE